MAAGFETARTGFQTRRPLRRWATLWTALCLVLLGGAAEAQSKRAAALPRPTQPLVETDGGAKPIAGWTRFCERHPEECALDLAEPAALALTPAIWKTVVAVNRRVNAVITPLSDDEHWGVADRWDLPEDGAGDCEDLQLLKRKLLADAGLPRRSLRVAVVVDEAGEGHAVLLLRTDRGDFVLDNKRSSVLPWHQTGYVFVKREGADGPAWVSLGGATSPSATANR